jgi:arginine metabolism regulation protein II
MKSSPVKDRQMDMSALPKDQINDTIISEESVKKQRRSKSFSGCYTCRRRKIACDLGRPSCLKCKKSGFVCEGYDVKLRWSQPIEFDIYGYQLPSKPNQETEYCQRRSIEYVKYNDKSAYKLYDEMDTDLAQLHNMYLESTNSDTVIKGHFGVFRGIKSKPKLKKRKATSNNNLLNNNNSNNTSVISNNRKTGNKRKKSDPNNKLSKSSIPVLSKSQSIINQQFQYKVITKNQNFMYPQNVSNSIVNSIPNNFDTNNKNSNVGNEWLSMELLDAALLTASALNGDTHFLDMFEMENSNTPIVGGANQINNAYNVNSTNSGNLAINNSSNLTSNDNATSSTSINNNNINTNQNTDTHNAITNGTPNDGNNSISNSISNNISTQVKQGSTDNRNVADLFSDSVPDQMLHMLFQGRNSLTDENNQLSVTDSKRNDNFFYPQNISNNTNTNTNNNSHTTTNDNYAKYQSQFHPQSQISKKSIAQLSDTSISSVALSSKCRLNQISPDEITTVHSVDDGITPSSIEQATPNSSNITHSTGIVPTTNLNNKFKENDQPIIDNEIRIHASNGIKMPKNIMEILKTTPLPKSLAIDKFGIPTTSLNVHPMARYLLNYYIEDVADMMTVIPLAKNPWKFIYFPRALMAIGELASLGRTSNARNGLLNALLAVSAFNLQSKFVRGSDEMKYYVDLGIQLRRQANEFVERCMEEDILKQKYKDVLTAVLSMVTIDVVWGTMSSCKIHLDHCEKIIEKKMLHKKKLSSKAVILHRIFSSLKLIQDSTSLENIQKSEIFLNEKNYKNFLTGSKPTQAQLDELNNDNFRGIFRGSKMNRSKSGKNNQNSNKYNNNNNNLHSRFNTSNSNLNSNDNFNNNNNIISPSLESYYHSRQNTNTSNFSNNNSTNSKRGKYNEKITDNGKVRIEFIVNNDDDDNDNNNNNNKNEVNANSDIPAFVDITRTSFQPSKNKLDDKVVSSDAIYGLPNSLILMFGEIVPLTRFKKYHEDHNIKLPIFFDDLAEQLEFKLLTWKLEWTLMVEDDNGSTINDSIDESKKNFISPRHEGIYHHVMSFYHALIIYFYRFIENVNPMYLLERIEKVLLHLNKIQEILENNKETSYIIPLFWQGFIAGSEAMTLFLQNGFNKWGQDIAQTGIGTYWNARQIMLEIWRRKNHNVKNNSWVDVLRDWKTNVMLT